LITFIVNYSSTVLNCPNSHSSKSVASTSLPIKLFTSPIADVISLILPVMIASIAAYIISRKGYVPESDLVIENVPLSTKVPSIEVEYVPDADVLLVKVPSIVITITST